MISKSILFFGKRCTVACDGRCDKAWGINGRPSQKLGDDVDDFVFLSDDELGVAPGPGRTIGISEGGDIKPSAEPIADGSQMNRWCTRECERSDVFEAHEPIELRDLRHPTPNMPFLHPEWPTPKKSEDT